MLNDKYDLCSDTVTLDYLELIKTAKVAVRYSLEALNQRMKKWYDIKPKLTNLDAEWLLNDAQALATATTALHYLTEGLSREEIIVVRATEKE
ncbi:unnamed protein product [marine sediment metagenome]|uniref:Uncharacterized protein n=1 Tax=marine sediment metagenome TaxID=412755 RepID=X1NLQ7_9ZZZZ